MPGLYTHTSRSDGTTLSASIYNADHENHITNDIPGQMDDYSSTVTQMRSATDPGEDGTEVLPTSLAGELERIRWVLNEIVGKSYWYETPVTDLKTVDSDIDSLNTLVDSGQAVLRAQMFS
jgi:hypothetical protein